MHFFLQEAVSLIHFKDANCSSRCILWQRVFHVETCSQIPIHLRAIVDLPLFVPYLMGFNFLVLIEVVYRRFWIFYICHKPLRGHSHLNVFV